MQKIQLNNQINNTVTSSNLTAEMSNKVFKSPVKQFIAQDEVYSLMNPIKGAPAYWYKLLYDVLVMVRHLSVSTSS